MSTRLLIGREAGCDDERVAMFDSVDGRAFGPTFRSEEDAQSFLEWFAANPWRRPSGLTFSDPRGLAAFELDEAVSKWRRSRAMTPRLELGAR